MTVVKDAFGSTTEGLPVDRFTIANGEIELKALTYGGVIQSLVVPGAAGRRTDVVLGFETLQEYEQLSPYFGAIIGRCANRLSDAQFVLDGMTHRLSANDGRHHLHGGTRGFDKAVWNADVIDGPGGAGVLFSRVSRAGEEGYPGDLAVTVAYTLSATNELALDYIATTTAPTIVNLTQHTYFNLSGSAARTIEDHVLTIRAAQFTPVNYDLIPTGVVTPVADTPFDFRIAMAIGALIHTPDPQLRNGLGYDHNWVLDSASRSGGVAASLHDPASGRTLDIRTSEPGLQFYSGNRLDIREGKGRQRYGPRAGLCLETQHFPDSPTHPVFPSTVLRPGQTFRSRTTWTFSSR